MIKKFGNLISRSKEALSSSVAFYNMRPLKLDEAYSTGPEYSVEEWERNLEELNKDILKTLEGIMSAADSRSIEERKKYIEELSAASPGQIGFIVGIDAKKFQKYREDEREKVIEYTMNINSMSPTNINNVYSAVQNLQKRK